MVIWMPNAPEQREYRVHRDDRGIWAIVVFIVFNLAVGLGSAGITTLLTQGFDLFCK